MKSSRILASAVLVLALTAMTVPAIGGAEFLAYGYAKYTPAPSVVNATMEVYGILSHPGGMDDPIPMDWATTEYTVYVTDMTTTAVNNMGWLLEETFAGGEIMIFADPYAGGTAADYANLSTMVDGDLILVAHLDDGFMTSLLDFDGDTLFNGSGSGIDLCDFDGGSRVAELLLNEFYPDDWDFLGVPITDPGTGPGVTVPAGFDRVFDLKITPPNDPTQTSDSTWGGIRELYR